MRRPTRWRSASGLLLIVLVGIGVVVLLGGTAVVVTSSPEFCRSCHLMETRYVSWSRSSHADSTNCITCHSEPGLINETKAHLAATRYLWVMATGRRSGPIVHGEAFTNACLECHPDDQQPDIVPGLALGGAGHVPAHKAHLESDVDCTSCHYRPSLHGEEQLVPMDTCVECHQERALLSPSCQLCHDGPIPQPIKVGQRQ